VLCFAAAGKEISITVTATNMGNVQLSGLSISLPNLELTCGTSLATSVAVGQEVKCWGKLTITQDIFEAGDATYTASASADGVIPVASQPLVVPVVAAPRLAADVKIAACTSSSPYGGTTAAAGKYQAPTVH
jgi:hypothetical protein